MWLYLLGVLSDDKSECVSRCNACGPSECSSLPGQEMTSVRSKYLEYDSLDKHNAYLEKRIRNESARYYQRKLIARPPPGRTLARSSQRLTSRARSSGIQTDPKGMTPHSYRKGPALDPPSGQPSTVTTMNRGPNRVDTGQSRMLAGIMGSSSVLSSTSASINDEEDILIDPEAASAGEMKRFCMAVENIVCAHLNRWKWKEGGEIMQSDVPLSQDSTTDAARSASSLSNGGKSGSQYSLTGSTQRDAGEEEHRMLSSPKNGSDGHTTRSRASTVSSTSSSGSRHAQENRPSIASKPKKSPALFPSLPKEYQWAHRPVELSATSTLFTLDSATLHGDQHSGQLVEPDYHPDLILLCSPFVKCIRVEAGMYFAFEKLMSMRGERRKERKQNEP